MHAFVCQIPVLKQRYRTRKHSTRQCTSTSCHVRCLAGGWQRWATLTQVSEDWDRCLPTLTASLEQEAVAITPPALLHSLTPTVSNSGARLETARPFLVVFQETCLLCSRACATVCVTTIITGCWVVVCDSCTLFSCAVGLSVWLVVSLLGLLGFSQ